MRFGGFFKNNFCHPPATVEMRNCENASGNALPQALIKIQFAYIRDDNFISRTLYDKRPEKQKKERYF